MSMMTMKLRQQGKGRRSSDRVKAEFEAKKDFYARYGYFQYQIKGHTRPFSGDLNNPSSQWGTDGKKSNR